MLRRQLAMAVFVFGGVGSAIACSRDITAPPAPGVTKLRSTVSIKNQDGVEIIFDKKGRTLKAKGKTHKLSEREYVGVARIVDVVERGDAFFTAFNNDAAVKRYLKRPSNPGSVRYTINRKSRSSNAAENLRASVVAMRTPEDVTESLGAAATFKRAGGPASYGSIDDLCTTIVYNINLYTPRWQQLKSELLGILIDLAVQETIDDFLEFVDDLAFTDTYFVLTGIFDAAGKVADFMEWKVLNTFMVVDAATWNYWDCAHRGTYGGGVDMGGIDFWQANFGGGLSCDPFMSGRFEVSWDGGHTYSIWWQGDITVCSVMD